MRKFLTAVILSLLCPGAIFAQGIKDIRINEFMVFNQTNLEDDYGNRVGWVELYNTGHSKVDVAGCYLSIDPTGKRNPEMTYRIPPHDSRTVIEPQGYLVFFCEGTATKGTFHTNFTLDRTGYIALTDASSQGTPISQVTYDVADQQPDVSMGYETVHNETTGRDELAFGKLSRTTPLATNEMSDPIPQHELFRQRDPHGYLMAITAMCVVFTALLILYLLFALLGKLMSGIAARKMRYATKEGELVSPAARSFSGEAEIAAIAMALHQFQSELHDKQATVLTINKVTRAYSPWSSKLYGLRQMPERNHAPARPVSPSKKSKR